MRLPFDGSYPLTQGYGENPKIYGRFIVPQPNGKGGPMLGHNGDDYGLPMRTPVLAPHSGRVIEAAFDAGGYGWYLKLENTVEGSVLAHFDEKPLVAVGRLVSEGQHIAYSGNTGNSTGPHLHWGYYRHPRNRNNGLLGFIDQQKFLAPEIMRKDIMDREAVKYAYLSVMDYEPTEDALKFWTGRPASELLKVLYRDGLDRRYKANNYDRVLEKFNVQSDNLKAYQTKVGELEGRLSAALASNSNGSAPGPGTSPLPKVDHLSGPVAQDLGSDKASEGPVNTSKDTGKETTSPVDKVLGAAKAFAGGLAVAGGYVFADPTVLAKFETEGWKPGLAAVVGGLFVYWTKNKDKK